MVTNHKLNGSKDPSVFFARIQTAGESFTRHELLDASFACARQTVYGLNHLGLTVEQVHQLVSGFIRPADDVSEWAQLTILIAENFYVQYESLLVPDDSASQVSGKPSVNTRGGGLS